MFAFPRFDMVSDLENGSSPMDSNSLILAVFPWNSLWLAIPRSSTQQSEQYHGPKMHVWLSPPFRFDSSSWPWILSSQVLDSDKKCSGRCVNRLLASSHHHLGRTTCRVARLRKRIKNEVSSLKNPGLKWNTHLRRSWSVVQIPELR